MRAGENCPGGSGKVWGEVAGCASGRWAGRWEESGRGWEDAEAEERIRTDFVAVGKRGEGRDVIGVLSSGVGIVTGGFQDLSFLKTVT